jgi:hypothetical protein
MKIYVKNQRAATIHVCCGALEYILSPGEEAEIEVNDQDCMYLD